MTRFPKVNPPSRAEHQSFNGEEHPDGGSSVLNKGVGHQNRAKQFEDYIKEVAKSIMGGVNSKDKALASIEKDLE